jgi:hypothetical protein
MPPSQLRAGSRCTSAIARPICWSRRAPICAAGSRAIDVRELCDDRLAARRQPAGGQSRGAVVAAQITKIDSGILACLKSADDHVHRVVGIRHHVRRESSVRIFLFEPRLKRDVLQVFAPAADRVWSGARLRIGAFVHRGARGHSDERESSDLSVSPSRHRIDE